MGEFPWCARRWRRREGDDGCGGGNSKFAQIYWIISHYCIFMITINGFEVVCRCHEQTSANCCSTISIEAWCACGGRRKNTKTLIRPKIYRIGRNRPGDGRSRRHLRFNCPTKWHTSSVNLHIRPAGFYQCPPGKLIEFQVLNNNSSAVVPSRWFERRALRHSPAFNAA